MLWRFIATVSKNVTTLSSVFAETRKAINEDYAIIKAFKKFVLDEPANSTYGLRNIKSFQVTKLK